MLPWIHKTDENTWTNIAMLFLNRSFPSSLPRAFHLNNTTAGAATPAQLQIKTAVHSFVKTRAGDAAEWERLDSSRSIRLINNHVPLARLSPILLGSLDCLFTRRKYARASERHTFTKKDEIRYTAAASKGNSAAHVNLDGAYVRRQSRSCVYRRPSSKQITRTYACILFTLAEREEVLFF